jgi:hypothetical protein
LADPYRVFHFCLVMCLLLGDHRLSFLGLVYDFVPWNLLNTYQDIDMIEHHCQVTRSPVTWAMDSTIFKFRPGDRLYLLIYVMVSAVVWCKYSNRICYQAMAVL